MDGFALNATSRDDAANERIGKQQPNNRDMLYKLLTMYQPFNQVSNKANGGTIGNFETLHDGLHNAFGLGHMGIVEVSAFDPIFWFHHANMDRIFALYQCVSRIADRKNAANIALGTDIRTPGLRMQHKLRALSRLPKVLLRVLPRLWRLFI